MRGKRGESNMRGKGEPNMRGKGEPNMNGRDHPPQPKELFFHSPPLNHQDSVLHCFGDSPKDKKYL